MNDEIYYRARKRLKSKKKFYKHLSVYIAVGMFFFIMNMVTLGNDPELWFFFPMMPWGVGLLIHYFSVFGLPFTGALTEEWEKSEMDKEMERARREYGDYSLPAPNVREDRMELRELEKEKQPGWNKEDLV